MDYMSLFLSGLIGASLSWAICSLWTVRYIDHMRRQIRETMNTRLEAYERDIREDYERLKVQEQWNRERA
jgi:hypothetical protein